MTRTKFASCVAALNSLSKFLTSTDCSATFQRCLKLRTLAYILASVCFDLYRLLLPFVIYCPAVLAECGRIQYRALRERPLLLCGPHFKKGALNLREIYKH